MTEPKYVSTALVAQALGVSVATVKRWVDDDVLPGHKTPGGHRKLLVADVLRLVQNGCFPKLNLSILGGCPGTERLDLGLLREKLYAGMQRGDAGEVRGVLHGAYNAGVPVETIADDIVAPTMRRVGDDWTKARLEVHEEHRSTQLCASALYELKALLEANAQVNRPIAIGGAPEHDHYVLPSLLAQMVLLAAGWEAINLGPHTPFFSLRKALRELKPKLIWISVSLIASPETFFSEYQNLYREAEASGVPIAVGGRALNDDYRTQMSYTAYGDGLTHLTAFARTLHPVQQRPRRGRTPHARGDEIEST